MTLHFRSVQNITLVFTLLIAGRLASQELLSRTPPQPRPSFAVSVTGSGRPMILIPGLDCPGGVWESIVDHYKADYEIHVLTIAGFAGEPAIPRLRLSSVKDDVIRYIRDKHLKRPVIAGHSLGGFLAFWVGATAPDLVDRIISVDGVPFLPALFNPSATAAEASAQAEQVRAMYTSMKPEQLASLTRSALSQMITEPKQIDIVAGWAAHSDAAFIGQAVYDLMTTDLRPEIAKLRAPVLLVAAGKGFAASPEQLRERRDLYEKQVETVPDHRVVVAANALHFIMYDDPEFLLHTMDEFLGSER